MKLGRFYRSVCGKILQPPSVNRRGRTHFDITLYSFRISRTFISSFLGIGRDLPCSQFVDFWFRRNDRLAVHSPLYPPSHYYRRILQSDHHPRFTIDGRWPGACRWRIDQPRACISSRTALCYQILPALGRVLFGLPLPSMPARPV